MCRPCVNASPFEEGFWACVEFVILGNCTSNLPGMLRPAPGPWCFPVSSLCFLPWALVRMELLPRFLQCWSQFLSWRWSLSKYPLLDMSILPTWLLKPWLPSSYTCCPSQLSPVATLLLLVLCLMPSWVLCVSVLLSHLFPSADSHL